MRSISPFLIVLWTLIFTCGIILGLIGSLTKLPTLPSWIAGVIIWLIDATWIAVILIKNRKKRKSIKPVLPSNQHSSKIMKETEEAVRRYTDAVTRKGLLKKSALYERPWFLLCGTSKSGKSSLLKGSGLYFPLQYPTEKDGLIVEGSNQIMWYFANEAVWIDTPGTLIEENGKEEWQALIAAMQKVRPRNPADGVAIVVNTNEVLNSDLQGIKELAKKLRGRIDELISFWGIEFPVYIIFNRVDEVPGFKEYFAEQLERGGDQIFGATLSGKMLSALPRMAFLEEFNLLCESLNDLRLDKLFKEKNEARKRMICRFVIHFEGIQQKLGALVTELFKPSDYEGKPIFRGFYFTSCTEFNSTPSSEPQTSSPSVSETIANHPLNPNRAFIPTAKNELKASSSTQKKIVHSAFVLPLFREIMVKDKTLVKTTQKRTRREMLKHYLLVTSIFFVAFLISIYFAIGYRNTAKFFNEVNNYLKTMPAENAELLEQYKALDIVHNLMFRLQKYEDKGIPLSMGIGFYRGKSILDELKKSYFYRLKRYMVVPALKYLEYDIRRRTASFGELAGEEYKSLYNSLKAYLSISEGGPRNPKEIDTAFLRPILLDAIKQSILATIQGSRLPSKVETILYDNMGLYLSYLSRGEFPRIQENQNLVGGARKRLARIPSAEGLYNAVISQLMSEAPSYTLDNILKREGEGILQSNATISILYTAEGWTQYVRDAINDAARDPCKSDWVIGNPEEELKTFSFDSNKLKEEMIDVYSADCKVKWLNFLGSISMEPFGDLQRASRILQKLVGTNSEVVNLLETVGTLTQLKYESEAEKAGGKVLEAASNIKATKKTAEKFSNLGNKIASHLSGKDPFDKHNTFFNNIRAFVKSSSALGGYEGYKDKVMTLAEKCGTIDAQGESKAIAIFNGKEDDPLLSGWNFTIKTLNEMPEELASSLRNILLQPFEYTGTAVTRVLTRTLNKKWQEDVIKQFTNRLSGRYPFNIRGDEASFTDVMDFFRPNSGTFWGFYDRVLSSFIVKEGNEWMSKPLGSVKLNFNPQIFSTLTQAERIKNIFFKEDGTIRSLDISITPAAGNKYISKIIMGSQEFELRPGSRSVKLNWPAEGVKGAILRVDVSKDYTPDINKNGPWGFMKLLQEGKISKFNNSSFAVKWSINVQDQYIVFIEGRVNISGSDHPFTDKIFETFDCPTILIKDNENKNL